jgi:hypothetical protein
MFLTFLITNKDTQTTNNKHNPEIIWAHTQRQPHALLFLKFQSKKEEAAKATAPAVTLHTALWATSVRGGGKGKVARDQGRRGITREITRAGKRSFW